MWLLDSNCSRPLFFSSTNDAITSRRASSRLLQVCTRAGLRTPTTPPPPPPPVHVVAAAAVAAPAHTSVTVSSSRQQDVLTVCRLLAWFLPSVVSSSRKHTIYTPSSPCCQYRDPGMTRRPLPYLSGRNEPVTLPSFHHPSSPLPFVCAFIYHPFPFEG